MIVSPSVGLFSPSSSSSFYAPRVSNCWIVYPPAVPPRVVTSPSINNNNKNHSRNISTKMTFPKTFVRQVLHQGKSRLQCTAAAAAAAASASLPAASAFKPLDGEVSIGRAAASRQLFPHRLSKSMSPAAVLAKEQRIRAGEGKEGIDALLSETPLLKAMHGCATDGRSAFHMPGHKKGQGVPAPFAAVMGETVLQHDLTELPELDNLQISEGVLGEAQRKAAEAWGSERAFFLINGSTVGIIASIWTTCRPGDKLLLQRNCHQSGMSGLVVSGAEPVFLQPEVSKDLKVPMSVTVDSVRNALDKHSGIRAVLITRPTYEGDCADLTEIAKVCHDRGLPLIVDEAHGAHLHFAPGLLPPSATDCGADIAIHSVHKTLCAMTQASLLHIGKDAASRVDVDRLRACLRTLQSTSPSYVLMASLDAARAQASAFGGQAVAETVLLGRDAAARVAKIPGLRVFGPGRPSHDSTRLTVIVSDLGISGQQIKAELYKNHGIAPELAGPNHVAFIISIGNTPHDIDRVVAALEKVAAEHRPNARENILKMKSTPELPAYSATTEMPPRDVFLSESEKIPFAEAAGRISAEQVCPYPPGIPVIALGDRISKEAINYILTVKSLGSLVSCSDPSLKTLRVVKEKK